MQCEFLIQARQQAGYPNRETAEAAVPFASSTIGRHERGEAPLQPADILAYAAGYRAPELPMLYCRNVCPIGCELHGDLQDRELSSLTLRVGTRIKKALRRLDRLEEIAEDDRVDAAERKEFDAIVAEIRSMRAAIDEIELYAVRIQNKTRQPAGNRTAASATRDKSQQQYCTGSLACQRG
jgi:hypothetical protein